MKILLSGYRLLFIFMVLLPLFFSTKSMAAFAVVPAAKQDGIQGQQITINKPAERFRKYPTSWQQLKHKIQHSYQADTESDTNTTALLSLVFGACGAAALIIGTANLLVWVLIVGFVFGIAATVLGGFRRHRYKGLGIAGLTLGIIDLALGAVLIPTVALVVAVTSVF